jgi:hypothetical protein
VIPVLTIRQPWASAILREHDPKTVENRTWLAPGGFRGRIGIHAGVALDDKPRGNPATLSRAWGRLQPADVERGAIIGTARLVDCHLQGEDRCTCDDNPWAEFGFRDLGQKLFAHWILAEPREFVTPIPARGMLGLWYPQSPSLAHLIEIAEVVR